MTNELNPDLIQTSRRFFGYALKYDANTLYEGARRPDPYQLGAFVTSYLVQEAIDSKLFIRDEITPVELLFSAALDNTRIILMQDAQLRQTPLESIPSIARDERTIRSIARLAMHNEDFLQTILDITVSKRHFQLSDDMNYIKTSDAFIDAAAGGCPFAATPEHVLHPDPLFTRTIHLAGDLTYLSYKK